MVTPSYQICDLFKNPDSSLAKIITQAKSLSALNQIFADVFGQELAQHCRVGQFEKGILTLMVDNAAYATRLRFSTTDLLSRLRTSPQWAGLISIQVKVQTYQPKPVQVEEVAKPQQPIPATIGLQLAVLIEQLQGQKGSDALVESLRKLQQKSENSE